MPFASIDVGPRRAAIPPIVGGCLKTAISHLQNGRASDALEAIGAAAVADIQQHQQTFLAGSPEAVFLGRMYEQALAAAGLATTAPVPRNAPGPVRLVYVLSGVVEGQAASANIARFLELHDRARFEPAVILTEECTRRSPPRTFLVYPDATSERVGAATLARMRAISPVHSLPTEGSYLDAVVAGIQLGRGLNPDLAVFVGSPACPVQAGMAFARIAPRQANLCVGVPLVLRGIDAVIFNNPRREAEDREFLNSIGVRVSGVQTSGADVQRSIAAPALARKSLGIPAGAPTCITVSNALPRRMLAGSFARDLGAFLSQHPQVWWVGVGAGESGPVRAAIESSGGPGVARRCIFLGGRADVPSVIKAADLYLNEYPEGGGNSVIESMGCGVPVVAMRAGPRHAEGIGAELAGDDAIPDANPAAYWSLAAHWIADRLSQKTAGARQQARALARFDYDVIARAYESCYTSLVGAAPTTAPAT